MGCSISKGHIKTSKSDIKTVLLEQQEAWNNGNIDAFMKGYMKTDDLTFIGSKGITQGWNQTLLNYKKGYPDKAAMGILKFDIIELKVLSSDYAYMIGKYTLTREEDTPSGYFDLLWQKVNNNWVIVSDHTSG